MNKSLRFLLIITFLALIGFETFAQSCSNVSNTTLVTGRTTTTVTIQGSVAAGGATCDLTEVGVYWDYSATITTADTKVSTTASLPLTNTAHTFSITITGINPGSKIFYRTFATTDDSSNGAAAGTDLSNSDDVAYTYASTPTQLTSGQFTLSTFDDDRIDLSVTAANALTPTAAYGYAIFRKIGSAPTVSLTNGTAPSGTDFVDETSITGGTTSLQNTGLTEESRYYYTLIPYGYDGTNPETFSYNTTSAITKNAWTLSLKPDNQPNAALTAAASSPININLGFPAYNGDGVNDDDGFIILRSTIANPDVTALNAFNGQTATGVSNYRTTISTTATSFADGTALPNTTYYYAIVPYNWDLTNPETYNYRTTAGGQPIRYANATTPKSAVTLTGLTTGGSNGLSSTFIGGNSGLGILGFSLTSSDGPSTFDGLVVSIDNNPASKLTNFELFASVNNALGGGDDTSLGTIAAAGAGPYTLTWTGLNQAQSQSTTYYYFLVANVDPSLAASSPFTVSFSQANVNVPNGTIGAATVSRAITATPATTTIAPATTGVAPSPLLGGTTGLAILGFSLTSNGSQNATLIKARFDTDPDATFNTYSLVASTDNDFSSSGNNSTVALDVVPVVSGAGPYFITFDPTTNISVSSSAKYFFVVANVDNTVATAASVIQSSLTTADVTVDVGITSGSSTGTDYSTQAPTATIASITAGVAASPLVGGNANQAILGFSLTSDGSQNATLIKAEFDTDPDATFNTYSLVESTDNDFATSGNNTTLALDAVPVVSGAGPFFLSFDPTTNISLSGTTRYFFVVANVDNTVVTAASVIQPSLLTADVTLDVGITSGSATGTDYATSQLTATIAAGTAGVAASPLVGGNANQAILGFSLTSNGSHTANLINARFDTDPDATLNTYSLVQSTDNDFATSGNNTTLALDAVPVVSGAGPFFLSFDPTVDIALTTSAKYFFIVANVDNTVVTAASVIQPSLTLADVTLSGGVVTGSSTGTDYATSQLTATIAAGTIGVAASPLVGGNGNQAILGFSLTSNGSHTATLINARFDTDPDATLNTYSLVQSTDNDFATSGNNTTLALDAVPVVSGAGPFFLSFDPTVDIALTTSAKYFFIVANVDNTVVTAASVIQPSLTLADVTLSGGVVTGSSTGTDYATSQLTATIASVTNGVAASPLVGGNGNQAILGFSLTSNGTQSVSLIQARFDTDPDATFNTYSIVQSTDNNFATAGNNTTLTLDAVPVVSGAGPFFVSFDPTTNITLSTSAQYFFIVANVDNTVVTAASVIQPSLTLADVTVGGVGIVTGSSTGTDYATSQLTATIADLNNSVTNGVVAVSMTGTNANQPIFGFSLASNGTQIVSTIAVSFDADPALFYTNFVLVRSTNVNADATGNTTIPLTSANVTGTGPWTLTIDPVTDITLGATQNFFLFTDVIPSVASGTDLIQASLSTAGVSIIGGIGIKTGSATGIDYDFVGLTTTLTQLTNGIPLGAIPLIAGTGATLSTSPNAILGFSLQSNGSQTVSAIKVGFDVDPTGKFSAIGLRTSTDNTFSAGDALVATTLSGVTGTGPYYITINITTPISVSALQNFFVVAHINGNANTTTAAILPSLNSTDVTLSPTGITAISFSGETYSFVPSNASTIAIHSTTGTNANIPFATYNTLTASTGLSSVNSSSLANFRIRDGGGAVDSDSQGTTVTDLTITISNPGDINAVALFDISNVKIPGTEVPIGTGTISYTGLSLTAADGTDFVFTVRATWDPTPGGLGDEDTHVVVVTGATASTSGSAFTSTTPFLLATTGAAATINNLNIVATKLIFFDLPVEAPPAPYPYTAIVHATDASNHIDKGFVQTASIIESGPGTGNFTAGNGALSPVNGVYTFNALQIDIAGTYNLTVDDAAGAPDLAVGLGSILIKSLGPDITPADMAICKVRTTVDGKDYYTPLDTLLMGERDAGDFNAGINKTFLLFLPAGWEYLTPSTGGTPVPPYSPPSISYTTATGANFTAATFNNFIGNTIAKFTFSVASNDEFDTLMIRGLFVRNFGSTAPDSILRSGTAVIEGVDETVNLGTLVTAVTPLANFSVAAQPGEGLVSPTETGFSFTSNPIILNGSIGGSTFNPDTVTFSGNGVSLRTYPAPLNGNRYVFSPAFSVPGSVPITMLYTNPTNGCISDTTKIFTVYTQSIQGVGDEICKNDLTVYPLTVNPTDIPPGSSVDPVTPFKYFDQNFSYDNRYINPSIDMILYSAGVPTSPSATIPIGNISAITINPINPLTGITFFPWVYDYYCYYTCGYIYNTPITNPVYGSYLYTGTSFIQLTINNHGLSQGDKMVLRGYIDYLDPYMSYGNAYTIVQVVNANNVIVNMAEVYGYPPTLDYGYSTAQMYLFPPYSIPVDKRPKLDTQIDFIIPGHTFANGDQIYMDYWAQYLFQPELSYQDFTVTVMDANRIRIDANESRLSPTSISVDEYAYTYYPLYLYFSPYLTLPGNYYDASVGYPYKGASRGSTGTDEFLVTNFLNNWPYSDVTVYDVLVDSGGKKAKLHSQRINLLQPPNALFTGLARSYCVDDGLINLTGNNAVDEGIFSAVPNFGLTDGGNGNNTGQFLTTAPSVVQDDTTKITYTVTDLKGCVSASTEYTIVHSLPTVDANAGADPVEVCQGAPVQIGGSPSATGNGAFTYGFTYAWSPGTGIISAPDIANPLVDPSTNQNYVLTVTDNFGCQNSNPVTVNSFANPTANAGIAAPICSDEEVNLNTFVASFSNPPADSAGWTAAGGGVFKDALDNVLPGPYFKLGVAKTYVPSLADLAAVGGFNLLLTTNDPIGPCSFASDLVTVAVNPNPAAPSVSLPLPVCVNGPAPTLQAFPAGGTSITWYRDPALTVFAASGTPAPSSISTSRDTIVYFYAAARDLLTSCEGLGTLYTIQVNPNPVATFTAQSFCLGNPTMFDGSASDVTNNPSTGYVSNINKFSWDFKVGGDPVAGIGGIPVGSTASGTYDQPSFLFTNPNTTYDVTLTVTTNDNCSNTVAFSDLVIAPYFNLDPLRIGSYPNSNFSFRKICEGDVTDFVSAPGVPAADLPATFDWDFDDLGASDVSANPNHAFTVFGTYDVSLIVTTNLDCQDTVFKQVPILPYLSSATPGFTGFPYTADFDTSTDGFVAQAVASIYPGISSWQWNTPTGTSFSSGSSGNAWYTYVDSLGTYIKNERSVLYTPCIDVTEIVRPVVSFDFRNDTDLKADGAYVEWAVPNPITGVLNWQRFGDPGNGKNWYNEALIRGLTQAGSGQNAIGQTVGQIGWSGDNAGWQTARYALDDYRLDDKLMLRIVFGSNDDQQVNDGFAVDNFKLSSRNRQVLVENYSSAAPSVDTENNAFNSFQNSLTASEIVKVQYHTNLVPNFTDPIYEANPADPNARVGFYGITNTSIPRAYLDGFSNGDLTPKAWADNRFSTRTLEDSPFRISINTIPSVDPGTITIVDSLFALLPITSGKLILHTLIVEIDVNGDSSVVRKMLPTAAGKLLTLPINQNDIIVDTLVWQVDNENLGSDLALVAFIQDQLTKEVYQSVINLTVANPPTSITDVENPDYSERINLFPNPANQELNIQLPAAVTKNTPVQMFDAMGRLVFENVFSPGERSKVVNTNDLTGGVYIVQIGTPEGGIARRKVMVVHR